MIDAVNNDDANTRDPDQQHIDFGVHVLSNPLASVEDEQIQIKIFALQRPRQSDGTRFRDLSQIHNRGIDHILLDQVCPAWGGATIFFVSRQPSAVSLTVKVN